MPIYEYECLEQKHRFEIIQKFSDPQVTHCTICGGSVQRVVSAPAIQFKGSGWYITDYGRKGSSGSGSSAGSTSDSSTAKPAATESSSTSGSPASDSGAKNH
ncbi:MAG TPA: FmdB family zinc ribbon protein [Acidobacteriota bacterium]|nr:FmdB family zinc ribbon protein [Acidobacteriota bacterium]